ncbi:MAG: PQQ-dependent sugar dehydrogenase [Myxococcota bacterium]
MVLGVLCTLLLAGDYTRVPVARDLARPWSIAFIDAKTALVTEKEGGVRRLDLTTGRHTPVTGLPKDLDNQVREDPRDNSGLFDIVLDPSFAETRRLYLSYASQGPGGTTLKVIQGHLVRNALQRITVLFEALPRTSERFHYGGGLLIADGALYITVGERVFDEIDEPAMPVAQNANDPRGKVFRIRLADQKPEQVASGIRAAQGLAQNPADGVIWFSEHGSRQGDELNVLQVGANYGWPVHTTGTYRNSNYRPPTLKRTFTPPAWSWPTTVAPTGMVFVQGSRYPEWEGDLLVAGLSRWSP